MLTASDLKLPLYDGFQLLVGIDTGNRMSALFVGFLDEAAYVFEEFPNYTYVSGDVELRGLSNAEWARWVHGSYQRYRPGTTKVKAWADPNTQFRGELQKYDLHLIPNHRGLDLRVEIAREYQQAKDERGNATRLFLAPWLEILPYEMEHAKWPDKETTAGAFKRLKENDHTLDCLEHCLSRRPRSKRILREKKEHFLDRHFREAGIRRPGPRRDPHLGLN